MAKIIPFQEKAKDPPDTLITAAPWEFRWSDWESSNFIQMRKSQADTLEEHRRELFDRGESGISSLPAHFILKDGPGFTIRALYRYRENEEKMREVCFLAGLVDCMVNQVNPLLRTDLLRDIYNKIMSIKGDLGVNWFGSIDNVLLPLDSTLHNDLEYRMTLSKADTMKKLYSFIREGMDETFDILSLEYVFYVPGRVVCP